MADLKGGTNISGNMSIDTDLVVNGTNAATSTSTGALQVAGGAGISGNVIAGGNVSALVLRSNIATGTAPIVVSSTTQVANLNAELAGTVTTNAQPNITSVGTLSSLTASGNITGANVTGTHYGAATGLTGIPGGNVTGTVANATYATSAGSSLTSTTATSATTAGTVTANAQPNITSVGTLSSLSVTGNISGANLTGTHYGAATGLTSIPGANVTGNVPNATFATSAGSATTATTATSATTAGTVTTAAQPNITSVGTLSSLSVTGNISGANITGTHYGAATGLTGIPGANITGNVSNATFATSAGSAASATVATTAGTVTTAAQPNITSVGSLTSLTVAGNANTGNLGTTTLVVTTGNITTINGGLIQNGNSNVTINANGNVTIAAVGGTRITATSSGANITGTLGVSGNGSFGNISSVNNILASSTIVATNFIQTGSPLGNLSSAAISTSNIGFRSQGGQTFTDNVSAASTVIANAVIHAFAVPTIIASNANITSTNAATFYIAGAPAAGTNMTITNPYALHVAAGNSLFAATVTAGNLSTGGTLSVTGNANIGNIGTARVLATANITAPQLISNVATGTAPFVVTSTTQVANLNVATAGTAGSATTAGTVTTNAQPNITSVGTLTSLDVTGNISANTFNGTAANLSGNVFLAVTGGNVGIGTTSPAVKLDVAGPIRSNANFAYMLLQASTAESMVQFRNDAAAANQRFSELFVQADGQQFIGRFVNDAYSATSNWLEVLKNTGTYTVKQVVFPTGNVGIGNSSPGQKLTVAGVVESTTGGFKFPDGSTQTTAATGSGSGSSIANGTSNVNIATSGGNITMSVGGTANVVTVTSSNVQMGTGTGGNISGANVITANIFNGITANTSGNSYFAASTGNVGIGTTSPTFKLQVAGTSYSDSYSFGADQNLIYQAAADKAGFRVGTSTNQAYAALIGIGSGAIMLDGSGGTLALGTSATERMRITSTGNVGIGTTSPGGKLDVRGALSIGGAGDASLHINTVYGGNGRLTQMSPESNSTAALNILASRNGSGTELWNAWGVDTTGQFRINQGISFAANGMVLGDGYTWWYTTSSLDAVSFLPFQVKGGITIDTNTTSAATAMSFFNGQGSGTRVGWIGTSGSATSYNTSSDERLKTNIVDSDSASDIIDSLRIRQFDWKINGEHQRFGMIAQELNEVYTEAVAHGPTEEDTKAIDYSKLVPLLVKEIQSLRQRVAKLEGK